MPIFPLKQEIELDPKNQDRQTAVMFQWVWLLARRRRMSVPGPDGPDDPRKIYHASFCPEDEWRGPPTKQSPIPSLLVLNGRVFSFFDGQKKSTRQKKPTAWAG